MEDTDILSLHDRHERMECQPHNMRREGTPEIVRLVDMKGGEGAVIYSRLTPENADRIIAEQIAFFQELGQGFEWKTYGHDTPSDLKERLLAQGLEAEDPETFLVLDLDMAPESLLAPVRHDVRHLTDPSGLSEIGRIQERVWGDRDPVHLARLGEDLRQDPDHVSIYIAYSEGLPVAHARITFQDNSPFACLWGGSTLAEYRGLGFYTALLAVRVQEARERGIRFLTIDASPMSRPIVERRGFKFLTMTQPFKFKPAGARS